MPDLDSKDLKKDDSLPKPVQMSNPNDLEDLFVRPLNKFAVSRTFGSLKVTRAVVDPNLHISESLLRKPKYYFSPPVRNLELSLAFGSIDAAIEVLPFVPNTVHAAPKKRFFDDDDKASKPYQISLETSTSIGNITLCVVCRISPFRSKFGTDLFSLAANSQRAQPSARIYVEASSTFGQTRVYIPRTFRGPLQVRSWARTPRLSPGLQRVASPVGTLSRWFIGDLSAWNAEGELGDGGQVMSTFGSVWVGYEGEEDDGVRTLGSAWVHWAKNAVPLALLLFFIYWAPWWAGLVAVILTVILAIYVDDAFKSAARE
ncbi:hypothetical protein C8R44DRAFT_332425 [Mycena epipterygia]|nr:hypothetical protein C8R44DRAFT_332425 [Mycena epipterygia]